MKDMNRWIFVVALASIFQVTSCSPSPVTPPLNLILRPASCIPKSDMPIPRLSPAVRTLYNTSSTSTRRVIVHIAQCFKPDQAYLDILTDPRINPKPMTPSTLRDPVWRQANRDAWAKSVRQLRDPVYNPLVRAIEQAGGHVQTTTFLQQMVVAELPISALWPLLQERTDIIQVSLTGELTPFNPMNF